MAGARVCPYRPPMSEPNPDPSRPRPRPGTLAGQSSRYRLLEAARAAASLAVLLFHSLANFPLDKLTPVLGRISLATRWGWLGVHVFFAISGWCIAERLVQGRRSGEPARHFALERILRIYPAYWTALAVLIAIRVAAVPFNHTHLFDNMPDGVSGWLEALLLAEPFLGRPCFLVVSWTLTYEVGFYLCAAAALAVASRRKASGSLLFWSGALLCFAPSAAGIAPSPWTVLDYWPEFFAGAAAWWAARRGDRRSGYGLLALMTAVAFVWPAYGGVTRLVAFGTAWVLALAWKWDDWLCSPRWMRLLVWSGSLSYSLYLIHVPLISPFENLVARRIPRMSTAFVGVWALSLVLSYAGAIALNHWVEAPVNRWRRQLRWRPQNAPSPV